MKATTSKFLAVTLAPAVFCLTGTPAHAAPFTVTNTNDSGTYSLRWAIEGANNNPGPDTIEFNIPVTDPNFVDVDSHLPGGDADPDVFVITPTSGVFIINDSSGGTTVDGRTQTTSGGDTNPFGPEIVLDGDMTTEGTDGFRVFSDDNCFFGMNIQRFGRNSDPASPFVGAGVFLYQCHNNWIAGNFLGTDATGTLDMGNGGSGVRIDGPALFNVVGTNSDGVDDSAEGNVCSGNRVAGITIQTTGGTAGGSQNIVAGNLIGTDAFGLSALGNGYLGVHIRRGSDMNRIGTDGDGVRDEEERNVISGNGTHGIRIDDDSDQNVVAGNFIGTNPDGTSPMGNGLAGITLSLGSSGNVIGTDRDGVADDVEGNVIAFNTAAGVIALGPDSTGNRLQGNSIHSNGGLGIDLAYDGVTTNDPGDPDTGPNRLQNYPDLMKVQSGSPTLIDVHLSSTPNTAFDLDFYASSSVDPTGHGEGERHLGTARVVTDASGLVTVLGVSLAAATGYNEFISATATDPNGNTSEFSGAVLPQPNVEDIPEFIFDLGIDEQVANAILVKAESAADSLEAGNPTAASNKLDATRNYVKAQTGKKLTEEEADLINRFVDDTLAGL